MIISPETRKEIARIKEYAARHVVSEPEIKLLAQPESESISSDPHRVVCFPLNYAVTYLLGYQPSGLCHHLGVSLMDEANPHLLPGKIAVEVIMQEFDIAQSVEEIFERQGAIWTDPFGSDEPLGVSVVVPVRKEAIREN